MSEPGREVGAADGLAEDSRARWPRKRTVVLPTVVATASVRAVAMDRPLIVMVPPPADHIMDALCLASVAKVIVHRGDPVGHWCPSRLRMNLGLSTLPRRRRR